MNYKRSRDAAWQVLIKNQISSLPVSVYKICATEGVRIFTYTEGADFIERLKIGGAKLGNDAFSIQRMIFYDDTRPITRQRFSVAHELGHILLHPQTEATVYNREISPSDDPHETEANIFASRVLAPICVLHYLNLNTPEEISEVCKISLIAAQIRFERLQILRQRDAEMRKGTGMGCFLLSRYEREVYSNFKTYIEHNKR